MKYGDNSVAAAIQAAHNNLTAMGWRYSTEDIGIHAKAILDAIYGKDEHK